jgi:hypothetical protein
MKESKNEKINGKIRAHKDDDNRFIYYSLD